MLYGVGWGEASYCVKLPIFWSVFYNSRNLVYHALGPKAALKKITQKAQVNIIEGIKM